MRHRAAQVDYFSHLAEGQLGTVRDIEAAAAYRIAHVVFMGTQAQVLWIDAFSVVAGMEHQTALGNWSFE